MSEVVNLCIDQLNELILQLRGDLIENDYAIFCLERVHGLLSQCNNPGVQRIKALINNAILLLTYDWNNHRRGRPFIHIPFESLEFLLSLDMKIPKIAEYFHVSVRTIKNRLDAFGLSVSDTYTDISEGDLDVKIENILLNYPCTGYKRMRGFLRSQGIKVTVVKIRESMKRVDPLGVEARLSQNRAVHRRQYYVQYSMQLWHIDTHHKLIRWGIVVRGGIDGNSRTIVYLDAGKDNTAESNLNSFMKGVQRYGIPLHTRSDKGGENVRVAEYMIQNRGTDRGSHICGRSVHNQRIERLWRDVFYGCLTTYKDMFIWLEEENYLAVDNPKHIAILQVIFLPRINVHLNNFMEAWNLHPISTENGKTPAQLMLLNRLPSLMEMQCQELENRIELEDEEEITEMESAIQLEDFQSYLSDEEREILSSLDCLKDSNMFGADIYIDALERINSMA